MKQILYLRQSEARFTLSSRKVAAIVVVSLGFGLGTGYGRDATPAHNADQVIDRAIASEHTLIQNLQKMRPVVEAYIQEQRPDPELGTEPKKDHYFLGRLDLSQGVTEKSYIPARSFLKRASAFRLMSWNLNMSGWAQMALIDFNSFDRNTYQFSYVRREFLGDVRCFVLDVKPTANAGKGRFMGRIWVEDEGYHIVRFNGTYVPQVHGNRFVHFDSWRVNVAPNVWIPSVTYAEEGALPLVYKKIDFKAQVRYWGYQLRSGAKQGEYTNLTVDAEDGAKDVTDATQDNSPVTSERMWQRQAEDNALDRLEQAGFLAPKGEVDHILETVLNNLEVTNDINVEPSVRVRILLTTPLESFTVGHTIVISRGLLDVLPDEASLAAIIAHELAHITLGHKIDTKFAFTDRLLFDDEATLKKMSFVRDNHEETEADAKAIDYLRKSPYSAKLPQAGLFLRQLSAHADEMPNLIRPLLGNRLAAKDGKSGGDLRLSGLMDTAPPLRDGDTAQIAALPLGSRIKLDPWTDQLFLTKAQKVVLLSPKEKLPFEVTPFMLHLTRQTQPEAAVAVTSGGSPEAAASPAASPNQ
jgi:hypothetical protein